MDCRTAYSHNRSNIRFDSIPDHQNLLRKYVQFPCHPAVIILALGRQHLYMMEIPVKPGFPEFCKLFDQITLGRYGQPVFSGQGFQHILHSIHKFKLMVCEFRYDPLGLKIYTGIKPVPANLRRRVEHADHECLGTIAEHGDILFLIARHDINDLLPPCKGREQPCESGFRLPEKLLIPPESVIRIEKDIPEMSWNHISTTGPDITGDQSNVGFVLMNQRTMETRFYEVEGATEQSAMDSAEGQVQNLHYTATFPLLLNISGEPTYFIALKDDAGLVKMYAMVNVQKYQIVATGDTVSACEEQYTTLMYENGIKEVEEDTREILTAEGKITKIAQGVVDGNSHYYIMIEGSDGIFDVSVADYIDVIRYDVGDTVTIEYKEGEKTNTVLSMNRI